ncbi:MAG TPA: oligosaccharide flippase family protein, partial [Burkholderiaceae bacterium]
MNTEVLPVPAAPAQAAPRETLSARTLRSGSWTIVGNLAGQALRFGSNLVLTRLLFPEAFGLMAIAQAILTAARLFSDVGLMQGAVRSARGHEQRYLDTIWTLDILKGSLIVLVMTALG